MNGVTGRREARACGRKGRVRRRGDGEGRHIPSTCQLASLRALWLPGLGPRPRGPCVGHRGAPRAQPGMGGVHSVLRPRITGGGGGGAAGCVHERATRLTVQPNLWRTLRAVGPPRSVVPGTGSPPPGTPPRRCCWIPRPAPGRTDQTKRAASVVEWGGGRGGDGGRRSPAGVAMFPGKRRQLWYSAPAGSPWRQA